MASTTQTHPAFPARNYSNIHNKLPDRNRETGGGGGGNAFGAPTRNQNPELRAPAQGGPLAPSNSLQSITDEQREEINEAVSIYFPVLILGEERDKWVEGNSSDRSAQLVRAWCEY